MNHRLRWSYPNLGYFLAFKSCIGRTKLTKATCGLGQKHLCSLPIMTLAKKVYYSCSSASSLPWKGGGGFFWSPVWPSGNRSPFHMSFRTCEVENERGEGALNLENVACNYQLKYELISSQEYVRGPNQALRKKRQDEGFRGKKIQADTAPASPAAAVCTNSLVIIQSKSVTSPSLRLWFLFRAAVCCWKAGWRMDMEWADFKWGHQISSILGYTGYWSN